MMQRNYSNEHWLILDNGCFPQFALELAKSVGKVSYFTSWVSDFPLSTDRMFGAGLEDYWSKGVGIQRVDDFWELRHKVDRFVIPDMYYADAASVLRDDLHKLVWSSFYGDELEIFRKEAKDHYKSLGLPVIPCEIVIGFPALRQYLKDHPKTWIKTDGRSRGDFETTFAETYELKESWLDKLQFELNAQKNTYKFIVEANVEGTDDSPIVEGGTDTCCIEGEYWKKAATGIEIKGLVYLLTWGQWANFPDELTVWNKAVAPDLKGYGYRNLISTEIRIRKEKGVNVAYQNDAAMRAGHPPNEIELVMIKNLADVVAYGSEGILVEPEVPKKFGAQLNLHSSWAAEGTQKVWFPESMKDNVRLRKLACVDGQYYVIPKGEGNTGIGCIAVEGDSWDDCTEQIKKIADQVKGDCIEKDLTPFDAAQDRIDELKKMGIDLLAIT